MANSTCCTPISRSWCAELTAAKERAARALRSGIETLAVQRQTVFGARSVSRRCVQGGGQQTVESLADGRVRADPGHAGRPRRAAALVRWSRRPGWPGPRLRIPRPRRSEGSAEVDNCSAGAARWVLSIRLGPPALTAGPERCGPMRASWGTLGGAGRRGDRRLRCADHGLQGSSLRCRRCGVGARPGRRDGEEK